MERQTLHGVTESGIDLTAYLEPADGFTELDNFVRQQREVPSSLEDRCERHLEEIHYCRCKLKQLREKFALYRLPVRPASTSGEGAELAKLLYERMLANDVSSVELTILQGADVNAIVAGLNLLHQSMLCGAYMCQPKVVLLLLAAGADPHLHIGDPGTPTTALQFAMEQQNDAPVCALIAGGADPDSFAPATRLNPVFVSVANATMPMRWLPCLLQHGFLRHSITDATWNAIAMATTSLYLWVNTAQRGETSIGGVDVATVVAEKARALAILIRIMSGERNLASLSPIVTGLLGNCQDTIACALHEDAWDRRRAAVRLFAAVFRSSRIQFPAKTVYLKAFSPSFMGLKAFYPALEDS